MLRLLLSSLSFLACLTLSCAVAHADEPDSQARAHFERGVTLADRGEIDAAIEAFEIAYRTQPHPAVLFNLGQAYSAGGRPVDAVRVLRSYLELAAPKSPRKEQAEQLLQFNAARIGRLRFSIKPEQAELSIDGRVVGKARDVPALELPAGAHVVTVAAAGYASATRQVMIRPWADREGTLSLTLEAQPSGTTRAPGHGKLSVRTSPAGATVMVDGLAYDGKMLPEGPHWLSVHHAGYRTYEQRVDIRASESTELSAQLSLLDDDQLVQLVVKRRRIAAYVSLGLGLAFGAGALALNQVGNARYEEWKTTAEKAVEVRRIDDAAIGCAVLSVSLLSTAVVLWFRARALHRSATSNETAQLAPIHQLPSGLSLRF